MNRHSRPYTLIMADRLIGSYATRKDAVAKATAINAVREKQDTGKEYWRVYYDPLFGTASMVEEGRE